MKKIFVTIFIIAITANVLTAQQKNSQNNAKDTTFFAENNISATANTANTGNSTTEKNVKTTPPPVVPNDLYVDEFDENKNEEEDDEGEDAANSLEYWTSERLNPYRIKIDSLNDTIISCSGFVFPLHTSHITSPFGARRSRFHYGTDIGLSTGDTVVAVFDGIVRIADYEGRGYGNYIVIRHPNGLESVYGHLSKKLVDINQEVKAGQVIGLGGSTGRSSGPHLHLELRYKGNAFNSTKLIDYANRVCLYNDYNLTKKETFNHKSELEKLKAAAYHRIRNGETLSSIARRYGTNVAQLCKLNRISKNTVLRVGRSIRYR
ncbi:MAG: peptidoglycan DD-metalloendopeptidase family protein [Prevotellaceae bacterium]|jgi:murein DD-endopeptidase MepM/ murein hydrolase activator NlpD|nr:peptidoglycan DD-metalloendopeptidase family protein [Prevotellaceae bacterium]